MITEAFPQPPRNATPASGRKVLFVIDKLMAMGGAEGALLKMVTHLPRYGYSCSIATFGVAKTGEFVHSFPCPVYNFPLTRVYDWQALRVARQLRQMVKREQVDVIHTMFPSSDLWGGPLARLGSNAVLVSGRRDMGIVRSPKHDWAYRWLRNQYDQVQAVSDAASQACIQRDGLSPERVFTVHNGIELKKIDAVEPCCDLASDFGLNPNGRTILSSSGQLWPFKGVDVLIRAAAIVCKQVPETNFLITGWNGNQYGHEMAALVKSLGLENNVKMPGRLSNLISVMKSCDIFALMSRSEGLSNALLEAMACGLPCVATNVGGNPEVVDDPHTGFLTPSEDAEAAAARILQLLRNPAGAREIGHNGQQRVNAQFSVDAMVSRMACLYGGLLAKRA